MDWFTETLGSEQIQHCMRVGRIRRKVGFVATCPRKIVNTLILHDSTSNVKLSANPASPNLLAQYDDKSLKPVLPHPNLHLL
jgi:hypothetical protein